jgi:hypothetical protein
VDSTDISFDLELVATLARPDPQLALAAAAGRLELRWPVLAGPHRLEHTASLAPPVTWLPVTNAMISDGYWNTLVMTNTPATTGHFFRLKGL